MNKRNFKRKWILVIFFLVSILAILIISLGSKKDPFSAIRERFSPRLSETPERRNGHTEESFNGVVSDTEIRPEISKALPEDYSNSKIKKLYPTSDYQGDLLRIFLPIRLDGEPLRNIFIESSDKSMGSNYSIEDCEIIEIAISDTPPDEDDKNYVLQRGQNYDMIFEGETSSFSVPPGSASVVEVYPKWKPRNANRVAKNSSGNIIKISGCEKYVRMQLVISDGVKILGAEVPKNGIVSIESGFKEVNEIGIYQMTNEMGKALFYANEVNLDLDQKETTEVKLPQFTNVMDGKLRPCILSVGEGAPKSEVFFYKGMRDKMPIFAINVGNVKEGKYFVPELANYVSFPKNDIRKEIAQEMTFNVVKVSFPIKNEN